MKLTLSHGCYSGTCTEFNKWRNELAQLAGYKVLPVVWREYNDAVTNVIMLDWGHITDSQSLGNWEVMPSDPLMILFAHVDYAGKIEPSRELIEAIGSLLPKIKDKSVLRQTKMFIKGLKRAANTGDSVQFSIDT